MDTQSSSSEPSQKSSRFAPCGWRVWLSCGLATTVIAFSGAIYAWGHLDLKKQKVPLESLANWVGGYNQEIISKGYDYNPRKQTNLSCFPGYPLAAKSLTVFGFSPTVALLLVSNASLLASFGLMAFYLRPGNRLPLLGSRRGSNAATAASERLMTRKMVVFALLAMGLWPVTFYFHVAYSESLLLCLSLLTMVAIARGWPLWNAAVIAGAATAVRPVAIALLFPIAWEAWRTSKTAQQAAGRMAVVLPIAFWGALAFMAYQWLRFGDPFASFATELNNWRFRPASPPGDKFWAIVTWEPIWGAYIPGAWANYPDQETLAIPFFSLHAANPIFWVAAVVLTALGSFKRWLTPHEALFAAASLGLSYYARGYETCMSSQGRLTAAVFPIYIVLACLLARLPWAVSLVLLALSAFMMVAYMALFTAGYWFV
jgi:hypothetical protein